MPWRSLLSLALGVALAFGLWWVHSTYLDHVIEVRLFGHIMEASLTVMLVALLLVTFVVQWSLKLLALVLFLPRKFRAWRARSSARRSGRNLATGLRALILGERAQVHKSLKAAGDRGAEPASAYYLAALAAPDPDTRARLLDKAARTADSDAVRSMARAQAALLAHQPAAAAEELRGAHKDPNPLRLAVTAWQRAGNPREALTAAVAWHRLEKSPRSAATLGTLAHEVLAGVDDVPQVSELCDSIKRAYPVPAQATVAMARRLAAVGGKDEARGMLREALAVDAAPLILETVAADGDDELVAQALERGESQLVFTPRDTALLRALAALSMRGKLWGQARKMLETAQQVKPEAATCLALARLAEAEQLASAEVDRLYRLAAEEAGRSGA